MALEWNAEDGFIGYIVWQDWQDEGDLFHAWTWYGEKTLIQVKPAL